MRALHQNIGKPRAPHDGRAGSALVAVLGVSMILMLAGVTMVVMSRQSMHRIQRTVHNAQAQAVAEAGVADMVAKLGTNYAAWTNADYTAPFFTNGTYHVTTLLLPNTNVLITSDGIYMEASNRTIMELRGTVEDYNNLLYGTGMAVMSDGNITMGGGNAVTHGDVHANGNVTVGNEPLGIVTATGTISPTATNHFPNAPHRPLPEFNFDSYRQMATNGGAYYSNNVTLSGTPIAFPVPVNGISNGVLYINGSLTVENNGSYAGTIVARDDITIVNNFTHTNFPGTTNMPSLLAGGTITLKNNGTLYGVVYGRVSVELQNNSCIYGGIMSSGTVTVKNNSDIYPGTGYPVWDPLDPPESPEVIVGGWLK